MKDILFEKHREAIFDKRWGNYAIIESQRDSQDFYDTNISDAAVACANTTKEIAKGFAEWIGDNYIGSTSDNSKWFKINYHDDATEFTTEQLLEKYLLTFNQ